MYIGQVTFMTVVQSVGQAAVWENVTLGRFPRILRVSLGRSLKAPKVFSRGKPEADRLEVCLRKILREPSESSRRKL